MWHHHCMHRQSLTWHTTRCDNGTEPWQRQNEIDFTMLRPWHGVDTPVTLRYIANNTHFMSCIIHLCKVPLGWHFLPRSEVSNSDCKLSYVNKRRGTTAAMAMRNVTGRSGRSFDIICHMHWFYCHLSDDFILCFLSQIALLMHETYHLSRLTNNIACFTQISQYYNTHCNNLE